MELTGTVTNVIPKGADESGNRRGNYGFIRDDAGFDRFFHANDLTGARLEDVRPGQRVEFTANDAGGKAGGRRAERVRLIG